MKNILTIIAGSALGIIGALLILILISFPKEVPLPFQDKKPTSPHYFTGRVISYSAIDRSITMEATLKQTDLNYPVRIEYDDETQWIKRYFKTIDGKSVNNIKLKEIDQQDILIDSMIIVKQGYKEAINSYTDLIIIDADI